MNVALKLPSSRSNGEKLLNILKTNKDFKMPWLDGRLNKKYKSMVYMPMYVCMYGESFYIDMEVVN